jgi:hypothetical protein
MPVCDCEETASVAASASEWTHRPHSLALAAPNRVLAPTERNLGPRAPRPHPGTCGPEARGPWGKRYFLAADVDDGLTSTIGDTGLVPFLGTDRTTIAARAVPGERPTARENILSGCLALATRHVDALALAMQ